MNVFTVYPSIELNRPRTKVCGVKVVHLVCVAGNTVREYSPLFAVKVHNHTLCCRRASSAGGCVDLDGVEHDLIGTWGAFVVFHITDMSEWAILITVTSAKMFTPTMATDRELLGTVGIVIQPSTTWIYVIFSLCNEYLMKK